MRVAIMQPTVLPYWGYFKLMKEVDEFILLDNVPFSKQSWQQRNRICINGKDIWLTIPVKQNLGQLIKDVEISDINKAKKIVTTVKQNYKFELIKPTHKLAETTTFWIRQLKTMLNLKANVTYASWTGYTDIVDICKSAEATEYISTIGSKIYFDDTLYQRFKNINCEVKFMEFEPDYSIVQYIHDEEYLKRRELI